MNNNEKTVEKSEVNGKNDPEVKIEKGCCGFGHGYNGFRFLKIFIAIALAIFIFSVIAALSHFGRFERGENFRKNSRDRGQYNMMEMMGPGDKAFGRGGAFLNGGQEAASCPMLNGVQGGGATAGCLAHKGARGSDCFFKGADRIFGAITKIEGNKITVMDNANQERILITQATTTIMSVSQEVGLKDLKVGQNINFTGQLNKDNQYEAVWIKVQ